MSLPEGISSTTWLPSLQNDIVKFDRTRQRSSPIVVCIPRPPQKVEVRHLAAQLPLREMTGRGRFQAWG
ncbi:helix-turn-helix domain-containing protein [Allorhizobium ampelinum]|uniref:helix-turn-helix domain-containing protein n=1 Tax=Allorhizobium ampelinum TaxID=3025782 RepID=UPI0009B66276